MFDPGYEDALHKRGKMERELAAALANDELIVRYQPQLSADGERIVGVEALVRWIIPSAAWCRLPSSCRPPSTPA